MRKILGYLFLIVVLFTINTKVFAEKFVCEYNNATPAMTMTWDTEKEFDTKSNPFIDSSLVDSNSKIHNFGIYRFGSELSLTESAYIDQKLYQEIKNNHGCNTNMRVCIYKEYTLDSIIGDLPFELVSALVNWDISKLDSGGIKTKLLIMTEEEYRKSDYAFYEGSRWGLAGHDQVQQRWEDGYNFGDVLMSGITYVKGLAGIGDSNTFYYKETQCQTVDYNGPYIGVNINCGSLKSEVLRYQKTISEYKLCNDELCKRNNITIINDTEDKIKSKCNSIFRGQKYSEAEKECVNECLNMKDTIANYKKGTDLENNYSYKDHCGFGQKLVAWIENIFRWIKYIVPVILIVLTILEFMGAMTGDKDDEMVKAKKHFIIRLVAIVLIFLLPPIIEFILTKMGFVYEGCGIF